MKIAIMQPYIFPYIGYFQLIKSVDKFVFYDDVNFIKKGWINRNNVLVNEAPYMFSIPLNKASQNKLILDTDISYERDWIPRLLETIKINYIKSPYFKEVFELIEQVFNKNHKKISELSIDSIITCCNYLGLDKTFEVSSQKYHNTKELKKADRLIQIAQLNQNAEYINPSGGKEIYTKEYFEKHNIKLSFIDNRIKAYSQPTKQFIGGLSIIDVLMNNSKEQTINLINEFELV